MSDDDKNKQETIGELLALRRRVEELEQMEDKFKGVEKGLQKGHRLYARAEKLGNFGHWGRNFLKDKAFWSEGMYDIFGVKPEDFQSTLEYFLKFVHPSDKKHLRSSIESSLSNREPLEVEYRIIRPDGEKRTVFSTAEIQVDPSGQPVGLFGICQDITERKRIERALRESEEKFRLAFRTTPDPISLSRLSDGMYIDINEGFTEVLGYTREDVIGKTSLELNIWSDPKDRERLVAALRSEGFAENLEAKFRRLDGEIRIGLMSARVLSMNQNNVILSVTRDITESKREEEALRQRTHDLGQRVKELNCLYGTSRLVEKGDISQEEIMIETLKLISPSMQYPENTGARITFEGREYKTEHFPESPWKLENDIIVDEKPVGKITVCYAAPVWSEAQTDPFLIEERVLIDAISSRLGRAVERIRDREALRQSEEKYRQLVEALPEGIFETDTDGNVTFVNHAAFEFFGYSRDDVERGLNVFQMINSGDQDRAIRNLQKLLNGQAMVRAEYSGRRKNGTTFPIFTRSSPIHSGERIIGVRGIVVDVSERKRLEAELHHAKKMQAVGTLAGGIAHEFNNILAIVLGNAELAEDNIPESNPARDNVEQIKTASLRAKKVVKQLLTFSRKHDEQKQIVNLVPAVKEGIKFLRSSVPVNIEFKEYISTDCDLVEADPTQIHQIILNLGTNAVHAMEEHGGILEFSLKNVTLDGTSPTKGSGLAFGNYVMLQVSDTGCGIPERDIARIYDPYFTTKAVGKGTGMGLAVVHGIVEDYAASIHVESELGRGTTFRIFFPAISSGGGISPLAELEEQLSNGNERILFVDDEEAIAKLGGLVLESYGYQVSVETNPTRALELFCSNPAAFDLVITDMTMPSMTGDKLIQEILKIRAGMPTILCTGFSERIDEERAKSIGVEAYALKPLDRKSLITIVRQVLDKRKSTQMA